MTQLPNDQDGRPIPVLGLRRTDGAHAVSLSTSSARNSVAFAATTRVISVYSTADCFIELGGSSVISTTSRHFLPAATRLDLDVAGGKQPQAGYLAGILSSGTGTLYISELE